MHTQPTSTSGTILHFPERRSIGRIEVWEEGAQSWTPLAEARWQVRVPGGLPAALWCDRGIGDSDLTPLASMPNDALHGLMLATPDVGDAGLATVEHLRGLRVLSAPGTAVTDAGLGSVRMLTRLVALNLSSCRISSNGVEELSGLRCLRALFLRGTEVDDAALGTLARLPELRYLHLSNTFVTDAGLAAVLAIPTLEVLAVNGSLVSADGIARLWVERPDIQLVAR